MHGQVVQPNGMMQYLLPIGVFLVIFALRARRMTQMRPLKLEMLWVVPAIYVVIVGINFAAKPPTLNGWMVTAAAAAIGAAIGWQRGRMMHIHVDPETHALNQKGSPWAILFLMAIILVKFAAQGEGRALGFDLQLLTDGALGLAIGMLTATRVEMFLRAKRLLAEARAAAGLRN